MPAPVLAVSRESYFLPYQDAWIDDNAPFKLAEKSRRVGFTYATSYRCFRKCLTRQRFTQWVSSRDMLTAKEFVTDYIARWCQLGNVVARGIAGDNVQVFDPQHDIRAFIVEFPTGSRIVSLSSTPEVFAGKGGDVLLDELDLHQDAGRVYDMARPCTTWGGQLEAISAYAVDGSPASVFAQLCKDARGSNPMKASLHRVTLDDAIAAGFVECVNKVTGSNHTRESFRALIRAGCRNEAAFQSQYMCNPQDDGGALLPYDLIRSCEVSPRELEEAIRAAAKTAPRYLGIDVGRKRDLTVMWLLAKIGDILWTAQVKTMEKALFRYQYATAVRISTSSSVPASRQSSPTTPPRWKSACPCFPPSRTGNSGSPPTRPSAKDSTRSARSLPPPTTSASKPNTTRPAMPTSSGRSLSRAMPPPPRSPTCRPPHSSAAAAPRSWPSAAPRVTGKNSPHETTFSHS